MEDSQDDLLKFLRERGVAEEKIEMFIENKIDCNVVLLMDEKIMETYLPAYGDQVATVAFCKARTRPNVNHEGTDGRNVTDTVERLRLKLNSRRRTSSQVHALSGKGAPSGNTYARKLQRRLELGWMDFIADSNEYKQVRAKSGGGVRHLCVDKDITLGEVGEIGKQTFFPSDRSKRGHIDQFTIELRDFQGCLSDPNETVKVAYEKSKLRMLRFYLYSKKIPVEKDTAAMDVEMGTPTVVVNRDKYQETCARACVSEGLDSPDIEVLEKPTDPRQRRHLCLRRSSDSRVTENVPSTSVLPALDGESDEDDPEYQMAVKASLETNNQNNGVTENVPSTSVLPDLDGEGDEDDPEYQMAVKASLEIKPTSFEDILNQWVQTTLKQGEPQLILLQRSNVLNCTLRATTKKTFKMDHPVKVVYAGEVGEDYGGPKREFLRELMCELQNYILIGPDGNKQFSHNIQKVSENRYFTAGQLVAFSVLHGGPSLPVLNPVLYKLMINRDIDLKEVDDDCILDEDAKNRLKKIADAPEVMKRLLADVPEKITFDDFRSLYDINFSPEGSNHRRLEQDTIFCFEAFIMDCEAGETGVTLEELLTFWTGATRKPPLGFPKQLEVEFVAREGDYLPVAHTCAMVLELQRGHKNPDKFASDMKKAVLWCEGFYIA